MRTDSTWTQVLSRTDYYPFGLEMAGRTESAGYRYGFNGYEKLEFESYTTQYRIYSSRIGKWWSLDPFYEYPSNYLSFGNNPILLADPTGGYTKLGAKLRWFKAKFSGRNPGEMYYHNTDLGKEYGFNTFDKGAVIFNVGNFGEGVPRVKQYEPNIFASAKQSLDNSSSHIKFTGNLFYGVANDFYLSFLQMGKNRYNLDGTGAYASEVQNAGVNTLINFNPFTSLSVVISSKTLNAGQFNSIYKGTGLNSAQPGTLRSHNRVVKFSEKFKYDAVPVFNWQLLWDSILNEEN